MGAEGPEDGSLAVVPGAHKSAIDPSMADSRPGCAPASTQRELTQWMEWQRTTPAALGAADA